MHHMQYTINVLDAHETKVQGSVIDVEAQLKKIVIDGIKSIHWTEA